MAGAERVGTIHDVPPGEMKRVEVGGKPILLVNLGGELLALDAECTHQEGPLEEGFLEGAEIECPWHGGVFDLKTGEPTSPPPTVPLSRYKVTVDGEAVLVDVDATPT